jgi:hypothetical protein
MRCLRHAATTLVLAAALAAGPASPARADPCDDSLAACLQGSDLATPFSATIVGTIVPIKDTERARILYRALIPAPYEMPDEPAVGLYVSKLDLPARVPGNPERNYTNWSEHGIDIRVRHGKEEGWYRLAVPLDSQFEWEIGRAAGFPKVHATTETLDGGRRQSAAIGGRPVLDLTWATGTPAETVTPALHRYALNRDPIFLLIDPLEGPAASRYRFVVHPLTPLTPLPEPVPGVVRYALDPDVAAYSVADGLPDVFPGDSTLAELIEPRGEAPGFFWDSPNELLVLRHQDLGAGGYAPAR